MNNKKAISIVVDEGADLPQEIIEKYQIGIVSLKVDWPEIENLPGDNTFQKMREAEKRGIKSFAKTSQPSPKDFLDIFNSQLEKFEKIICLTITSRHSGTYNSAFQAKRFLEPEKGKRVFVIDSLNGSCGLGLLVLKVIDLIESGKSVEEILKELEEFIPQIRLYALLEDPKWLEASGRISGTLANWIRKAQKIGFRPLIGIKKGKIGAVGIKTGVKDIPTALFRELESKTKELRSQGKKIRVAITHGDDLDSAKKLKEMIESELENTKVVFINLVDDIIGSILGPDTIILAWAPID